VTHSIDHSELLPWTFASAPRYFSLAMVLLIVLIVINHKDLISKKTGKLLKIGFFLLLIPTFRTHYYKFTSNRYNTDFVDYEAYSLDYKPAINADIYLTDNYSFAKVHCCNGLKSIAYADIRQLKNILHKLNKENSGYSICIQDFGTAITTSELNAIVETHKSILKITILN
jgi:hypothetical protein